MIKSPTPRQHPRLMIILYATPPHTINTVRRCSAPAGPRRTRRYTLKPVLMFGNTFFHIYFVISARFIGRCFGFITAA